jgi:Endoribonuclease L-PSP
MERRIVNPWTWQDQLGYVQANDISGMERVLVCAGQTSVDADGQPLHDEDMGAQVGQALDNLEAVLGEAGFALADVVRFELLRHRCGRVHSGGRGLRCQARPGRLQAGVDPARRFASGPPTADGRDRGDRRQVAMAPHVRATRR